MLRAAQTRLLKSISTRYMSSQAIPTAGFICIGDEILNGKTHDTNGNYFAKTLFDLGLQVRKMETIPDEEDQIIDCVRRFADSYDFVVTSGGIGPTHDDITYSSIAKAFDDAGELYHHQETWDRMQSMSKGRYTNQTPEQETARKRMALFPKKHSEILSVDPNLWVPVVRMKGKVCILPGVPKLFQQMLDGLVTNGYVPMPDTDQRPMRYLVHTKLPESTIAPFLTKLDERGKADGIRIGSYPKLGQGVDVSLIGRSKEKLEQMAEEVVKELEGKLVLDSASSEKSTMSNKL